MERLRLIMAFTEPQNVTRIYELMGYANEVTSGFVGGSMIFIVILVVFAATINRYPQLSVFLSLMFGLLSAIPLRFIGIISDTWIYILLILWIASLFFLPRR